ncbi:MAG: M56 family metallopeptidase [Lachnospiraceae bacterium]
MQGIFTQVLEMSMTASVIIAIVLVLRVFLQRVPRIFSYALWIVVAVRLLCPISFESAIGILPSDAQGVSIEAVEQVSVPQMSVGEEVITNTVDLMIPMTINQASTEQGALNWMEITTWIWMFGMGSLLVYCFVVWVKLRRTLVGAVEIDEGAYLVDHIPTPFVLGVIKPKIYVPCGLSEVERELVITHERIHIKRLDYIARLFAFVALTVHWFNPFVWVAFIVSERDMELSCDEAAVKGLSKEKQLLYAETLFTIATGKRLFHVTPLAFGEGSPKARIKNILHYKKPTVWIVGSMVVVISIVSVCLMSNQKSEDNSYQTAKEHLQEVCREYLGIDLLESEEEKIRDVIATEEDISNVFQTVILDDTYEITLKAVPSELYEMPKVGAVAMHCIVSYQSTDGGMQQIELESGGTGYPVSYNETGILVQSNYYATVYGILSDGSFGLKESVYMTKDVNGDLAYEYASGTFVEKITEDEYLETIGKIVDYKFTPVVFE